MAYLPIGRDALPGKTIERIARGAQHTALVFADCTFCVVLAAVDYDEEPHAWFGNEAESDRLLASRESVHMRLQTAQEHDARFERRKRLMEKEQEHQERAQLAYLKAKYEGVTK